jgi:ADP-ribose pyrophosphatase YjhB (NUDIX family)
VKCLIENDNHFLLIKTSYSGNYWTLPGGGCGLREIPELAIKREVKEELNIYLGDVILLGTYKSSIEYKQDTISLFYSKTHEKRLSKNHEVSQAEWFPINDLPKDQSRALKESLKILKK